MLPLNRRRSCSVSPRHRLRGQFAFGLFFLLLFFAVPVHGQPSSSPTPLEASDILKLRDLGDVTISPSGRNVAYTVRRAVPEALDGSSTPRYVTQLRYISASGRDGSHVLTRPDRNARQPAWHPDGHLLAFVRPVDGIPQIFLLSLTGGEPYQLTEAPFGATRPRWSPTGDRILFATAVPKHALMQMTEARPPVHRPGRAPGDLTRQVPPDTLLVLRRTRTLEPVDTLALEADGPHRVPGDTAQSLRLPPQPDRPPALTDVPVDTLRILPADSVSVLFDRLSLRPDTITVPARPDTAASPDGNPVQMRRWMAEMERARAAHVYTREGHPREEEPGSVPTYRHYAVVPVPDAVITGDPPRPAARRVTRGYRSYEDAVWLPGGTQLLVSAPPEEDPSLRDRDLYVVDLRPYRLKRLLDVEGYRLMDPQVTSDGTMLAFRMQDLSSLQYDHADIGLFALDGRSAPQIITGTFNRNLTSLRWSPDGWYLYATASSPRGNPLYRFAPFAREDTTTDRRQTSLEDTFETSRDTFSLDTTMVRTAVHEQVVDPSRAVQSFDVTDSRAVYASGTENNPSELYSNTISFNTERRLTSHNASWLRHRRLATSQAVSVQRQGATIDGRITRPPSNGRSAPSPLLVVPRGGPAPLDASDPISRWFERQYLAGQGYAYAEVWPRGSSEYGDWTRRASFQNWGPDPGRDVLALADTVSRRPWVASEERLIAGRGYGAYLSAWLIGQTNQFRAAVAQGGVYDLSAFLGEGRAGAILPAHFGGYPWENPPRPPKSVLVRPTGQSLVSAGLLPDTDSTVSPRRALSRNSPIQYVPDMETPLLLLHGAADQDVGASQAERLFHRLHVLNRPVEYVQYPEVGHDFSSSATPTQRVDRLVRLYEFLSRFASVDPGPTPPGKADR